MKGVTSGVEEKRGGHCLAEDQVIALMAGELDPIAFAEVEQHLDGCRLCRLLVSTLAAHTVDGPARGTISAFAPGDLVADRYRLIALLGVGGMGEVYEALDMVLGETIALKTIAVGATLGDRGVERLKAEVQFARSVTHRNVCRVFDVGFHTDGAITIAVRGETRGPDAPSRHLHRHRTAAIVGAATTLALASLSGYFAWRTNDASSDVSATFRPGLHWDSTGIAAEQRGQTSYKLEVGAALGALIAGGISTWLVFRD